jgi:predicted GIY-YIG superfamily endonuclease
VTSPPNFQIRIAKKTRVPEEGGSVMSIIIGRLYPHLEKELNSAFKGQEDVKIILDRRYGERRKRSQAFAKERRKATRRRPKEELVEVVIST